MKQSLKLYIPIALERMKCIMVVALIFSMVIIVYAYAVMFSTDKSQVIDRNYIVAAKASKMVPQNEQAADRHHTKESQANEWASAQCQNMDNIHTSEFYNDDLSTPLSDSQAQWRELKKPLDTPRMIEERKRDNWHSYHSADMGLHREKWIKYLAKDFKNRDRNLKLSSHRGSQGSPPNT